MLAKERAAGMGPPLFLLLGMPEGLAAEKVAVAALRSRLVRVIRRVQQLVDRRIGADRRGGGGVDCGSRLIGTVRTIVVACGEGAAGNGQKGGGSENNLFHFCYSSIFFPVRLAACLGNEIASFGQTRCG